MRVIMGVTYKVTNGNGGDIMRLASIIVNTQNKARAIVDKLHKAKRGGYYESFIDDKLNASYVVIYSTRGRGLK